MKIGVLEAGKLPPELEAAHGPYGAMFARLLAPVDETLRFENYAVVDMAFPASVDACDAWIVSGSKHGVYDDLPFIAPLGAFLRDAYAAGTPLIGVCFGHQIMAHALGGRAEKSEKGWGAGVHGYQADIDPAWRGVRIADDLTLHAMHQDQVTIVPPDARTIARSPFCAHAALAYGPIDAPRAISIQPHPEFNASLMDDLIALRGADVMPETVWRPARDSLGVPVHNSAIARWMVAFLRQAAELRAAA